MDARMYRIQGGSHRLLFHRAWGAATGPEYRFELVSLDGPAYATQVLPALRRLADSLGLDKRPDDRPACYSVTNTVGATGADNWRLMKGDDFERPTSLGTIVIRRERQVAKLHLSRSGRFTCGFSGPIAEVMLLVRMSGLEHLTSGWEYTRLTQEPIRFKPEEYVPGLRRTVG